MLRLRQCIRSGRSFVAKAMFLCLPGLLLFHTVQAQSSVSDETFMEKFSLYRDSDPTGLLFVHSDKTLYTKSSICKSACLS